MTNNVPNHFSHAFELNVDRLPTRSSDRTSWQFQLPGIVFGFLLACLGLMEYFHSFRQSDSVFDDITQKTDTLLYHSFLSPAFFDFLFIVVGGGMVVASIASYIRYKKIIFDGKNVSVTYRPALGEKTSFKENLKNYYGVRFRIEFFQYGFLNRNKYIIELYHKNPSKIIPLYISLSSKNIRHVWKEYARKLNLPALADTESGVIVRDIKTFDKSIKEMAELGYIIDEYDTYEKMPETVDYVKKSDKIVLKARKIVWDAYNFLVLAVLLVMAGLMFAIGSFAQASPLLWGTCILGCLLMVMAIFILFRKEKIVIKRHKLVNTHKYMFFSTKHDEMEKIDIKAIDITENPVSGRYFVGIISDDKTITFGSKLPINDLKWIKKFLIHEIIK